MSNSRTITNPCSRMRCFSASSPNGANGASYIVEVCLAGSWGETVQPSGSDLRKVPPLWPKQSIRKWYPLFWIFAKMCTNFGETFDFIVIYSNVQIYDDDKMRRKREAIIISRASHINWMLMSMYTQWYICIGTVLDSKPNISMFILIPLTRWFFLSLKKNPMKIIAQSSEESIRDC